MGSEEEMMRYYLYDAYPKQIGVNRFYISTSENKVNKLICIDNSFRKIVLSWKLLLKDWEGLSLPKEMILRIRTALSVPSMPLLAIARRQAKC